jgi:hypothetical protein
VILFWEGFAYKRLMSLPPIIVVGMHRSGTTLLVRLLEGCGVWMGAYQTANKESLFFQSINRTALDFLGYSWRCIDLLPEPEQLLNHYHWLRKRIDGEVKKGLVQEHFGRKALKLWLTPHLHWGWKDPRNSLTLPLWSHIFPEATVIHIYRDGRDAALSLLRREEKREQNRNFRSQQETEARFLADFALWEAYIRRVQAGLKFFQKGYPLKYEELLADPGGQTEKMLNEIGLPVPKDLSKIVSLIDETRTSRHKQVERAWIHQLNLDYTLLHELGYE